MVSCLQGYNIYLQYHSYIEAEFTKINPIIYQSIDEELNIRTRITKNPDKIGSQHSYLKVYEPGETAPKLDKGEKITDVANFDVKKLKSQGLINSETDLITLILQDSNEAKGRPIQLARLDTIFKNNLKEDYEHSILLLDNDKKVIQTYGRKDIPSAGSIQRIMQLAWLTPDLSEWLSISLHHNLSGILLELWSYPCSSYLLLLSASDTN